MTTTMEQMVIQLQQELFTLKAQVAARVQIPAGVQVANNLTTKDLGHPKEFSGKKEDFKQWSKETEAFFAGVSRCPK